MKPLAFAMLLTLSPGLWSLDAGGSVEAGTSFTGAERSTLSPEASLKLWLNQAWGRKLNLLVKAGITQASDLDPLERLIKKASVRANLEYLVLAGEGFWIGRTDFRDFSGTVLNTRLDGFLVQYTQPVFDLRLAAGTTAGLFKSLSTVAISEEDVKDRMVDEDWLKPSTLWASPRVLGMAEGTLRTGPGSPVISSALLVQYDLRPGSPAEGDAADTRPDRRTGAPVSTLYLGLGAEGRLTGQLFWNAWVYGMGGRTLTPTGLPAEKKDGSFQVWKSSWILAGIGSLNLTYMVPEFSRLVVDLGLRLGSWDPDGPSPDQNLPENPSSLTPTLYTGWTGISRTGGALIFNPQPSNVATAQLLLSLKPLDSLQTVFLGLAHLRPSGGGISEAGVKPASRELYLGFEGNMSVLWRPMSDLGASLGAGIFLPNKEVFDRSPEFKVQTALSLAF